MQQCSVTDETVLTPSIHSHCSSGCMNAGFVLVGDFVLVGEK